MIPRRFLALLLAAGLTPTLLAQESALSLEKAVETALSRNPDVQTALAEVKAASARRLRAEARPDPALALAAESIPWGLKAGEDVKTELSLGIEQTFEYPGRRAARVEIGRLGEDIAAGELERIRLVVSTRVKRAYYRAVLAGETLAALEPAVETLDRMVEHIRVRIQAGGGDYGDIVRTRIERARVQNRVIEARRERDAAMDDLFLLLGLPANAPPRLTSGLACPPLEKTAAELLSAARASRPSLRIARLSAERAAAATGLAGLNRKPDLSAGLFVPSKSFGGWGFSLGLSLPLSAKRWSGERDEAAAARESAAISADAADNRLAALIGRAYAAAEAAAEQVRIFERSLLVEVDEELKLAVERYRSGRIESYALIDLERSATEARLEYLRALYAYAIALADLESAGEEE
jgi:cobalt-zinc-cadmium efflux system outer membrane protein